MILMANLARFFICQTKTMLLGEIIERNARRYPNKTALSFKSERITFKDLNQRANKLANGLYDLGVKKGDRIAIVADTCPQHIEISCAGIKGGTVITLLNPGLTPRELIHLMNNAEASTIIFGANYKGLVDSLRPELKSVRNFIIMGDAQNDVKGYEALIEASSHADPGVETEDDDLLFLVCSGGTTGLPKQIMHTYRSSLVTMLNVMWAYNIEHEDICLFAVPAFWGQLIPWLIFSHFYMGCSIVILKDVNPKSVLETIQQEKITTNFIGSPFLPMLLDSPELKMYDHSSLRRIVVAGAPLPTDVWKRALSAFGDIFGQVYGLSEMSPITFLRPEDFVLEGPEEKVNKLRSCGREIINMHARVVDDQGKDVAQGEVGEVIAKGRSMMAGYWNAPKATEETIRGGYLYTGDVATIDEEGYIFLMGRRKDVITSRDKILSPSEIEDIIYTHPSVQEAAVIGVPDDELGEAVKAVVVLKTGEELSSSDIISLCQEHLPPYAVPQSVDFAAGLPKSPVGKVLKHKLRDKYATPTS